MHGIVGHAGTEASSERMGRGRAGIGGAEELAESVDRVVAFQDHDDDRTGRAEGDQGIIIGLSPMSEVQRLGVVFG